MVVIATAGHVDHGKSTLVRALTGMEPDRLAEEKRRELTIDLGYAWTTLESGRILSFVDVPGHSRFIGNMLAGLGPVPAVMLVVAADAGWSAQTEEHVAAIDALGVSRGLLVVTRADRADPVPVLADAQQRLSRTSLGDVAAVAVSAPTGQGMDQLRTALDALVASVPEPDPAARTRLWVDRSFTVKGAGTVVTGTLGEGSISVGDTLDLLGGGQSHQVTVRGLQSLEQAVPQVTPVVRAAVNLKGVPTGDISRGAALVQPEQWHLATQIDVRLKVTADLPSHLHLHVGTASQEVRVRPLGEDVVRLRLPHALPLVAGDRAMLRNPGTRQIHGITVLDVDPPELRRRGAAKRRAADLADRADGIQLIPLVAERGWLALDEARRLGASVPEPVVTPLRAWPATRPTLVIHDDAWARWVQDARSAVHQWQQANPMTPRMPMASLSQSLDLPQLELAAEVARAAELQVGQGKTWLPGTVANLGPGEPGMCRLEQQLREHPFIAPTAEELDALGLTEQHLRVAAADGRILRLADDALLAPAAPALAMRELSRLPQPFTLSQARQALGTTRRVAVPLLELLDARGWTRRVDQTHREVVR